MTTTAQSSRRQMLIKVPAVRALLGAAVYLTVSRQNELTAEAVE